MEKERMVGFLEVGIWILFLFGVRWRSSIFDKFLGMLRDGILSSLVLVIGENVIVVKFGFERWILFMGFFFLRFMKSCDIFECWGKNLYLLFVLKW